MGRFSRGGVWPGPVVGIAPTGLQDYGASHNPGLPKVALGYGPDAPDGANKPFPLGYGPDAPDGANKPFPLGYGPDAPDGANKPFPLLDSQAATCGQS